MPAFSATDLTSKFGPFPISVQKNEKQHQHNQSATEKQTESDSQTSHCSEKDGSRANGRQDGVGAVALLEVLSNGVHATRGPSEREHRNECGAVILRVRREKQVSALK